MDRLPELDRIKPGTAGGNGVHKPWLIVLSDWREEPVERLIDRVEGVFADVTEREPLPTVLVVDDVGGGESHEAHLDRLTEAGAVVLSATAETEKIALKNNPVQFARQQLLVITQPNVPLQGLARQPRNPDGFKEFATAFTHLSPEEMADLVEGKHPDDSWRYDI